MKLYDRGTVAVVNNDRGRTLRDGKRWLRLAMNRVQIESLVKETDSTAGEVLPHRCCCVGDLSGCEILRMALSMSAEN
jgi:hypothetical protein